MRFKKVLWGLLVVFIVLSVVLPAKAKIEQEVVKEKLKGILVPFVENKGQIKSERVKFYAKTLGGTLFVEKDGILTYNLPAKDGKGVAIKEVFKKPSLPRPGKETITKVNYFMGKDKKQWRTGIATYESVIIKSPFAGINLTLKAYGYNVEKIFQITPKAIPERVRIKIEGTKGLRINARGQLELTTELGSVKFTKPIAYQEINGEKREIEVSYVLYNKDSYGFKVGAYDRNHDLFIDPMLASTYVGGSSEDCAYTLALDSSGNVYVAGETYSSDYPTTSGAYDEIYNGDGDVVISKLNSSLTILLASTYVGGSSEDCAYTLALDSSGNVYVAGETYSSDYPTTSGAYDETYNGDGDVVISKLDSNLSAFSDVSSDYWAFNYIQKLRESGITTGYPDGIYRPENLVTRAEMAAFLIRAVEGEPPSDYCDTGSPFDDVLPDAWSCKYIKRLCELDITTGYPDGTYRPGWHVTRAEMAAFLIRAKIDEDFIYKEIPYFPDVSDPTYWAFKYIQKLKELGITTGYPDGTYRPENKVTRAEMAAFLARAFLGMP